MSHYTIVRFFRDHPTQIIRRGVTLAEAQAHCSSPETSSETATTPNATRRTERKGPWFDGYQAQL